MNLVLRYLHIRPLGTDSGKETASFAAPTVEGTDSPRDYQPSVRKPRARVRHDVEQLEAPKKLRATLHAQTTAGKQDSAEMYRSCFATAKSEPIPEGALPGGALPGDALPAAPPAQPAWLRAADYSVDALAAMTQDEYDRVDFSRPAGVGLWEHDLCVASQERWLGDEDWELPAKTERRATAALRRLASDAGSDAASDDYEYTPKVGDALRSKLSTHGASLIARMSDADLNRCDVVDYFE